MKRARILTIMTALVCTVMTFAQNINFADPKVKEICVANWDTNGDGELSYEEAAAVENIGYAFVNHKEITSFNEFQYFTGVTCIELYESFEDEDLFSGGFKGCSNLKSIVLPNSVQSIYGITLEDPNYILPWDSRGEQVEETEEWGENTYRVACFIDEIWLL